MSSVRIGVDVGGTFTDLVLAHEARGELHAFKLLTTRADPARAVMEGVRQVGVGRHRRYALDKGTG